MHPEYTPLVIERFWTKVKKSDGCWEWQGVIDHRGYGVVTIQQKKYNAHRTVWLIVNGGELLTTEFICHHCDNKRCVRPDHLFKGTIQDNVRDMIAKGRGVYVKGEAIGTAKLTADQVRQIVVDGEAGIPMAAIARRFHINRGQIRHILKGEYWRSVTNLRDKMIPSLPLGRPKGYRALIAAYESSPHRLI